MEKLEKKNGMEKLMLETLMEQQREYLHLEPHCP